MKKLCWTLSFVGLLSVAASAEVTKEDVRRLVAAGVSEDVILAFIRTNGPVVRLTADDLVELKAAGAGDRILSALLPAAGRADVDLPIVSRPAVVETPYLYDSVSRCWVDLNARRVVRPLCTWGPTFTTMAPVCRSRVPVCRPVCAPPVRVSVCVRR